MFRLPLYRVAVAQHSWSDDPENPGPTTQVHVIGLDDGAAKTIEVPNCSDNIIVPGHGKLALLAPTFCANPSTGAGSDPISAIDLTPGSESFIKNLPGFGPVALGPDGVTAIGFLDMQLVNESLFDDPAQIPDASTRFHLMVIDTDALSYSFHTYGAALPRYALTPDGSVLLVDEAGAGHARLFDVETASYRTINGPTVHFEQLSFKSDGSHAYVLSDGKSTLTTAGGGAYFTDYQLFDLDIVEASTRALPTSFRPRNVNISPDDTTLFLRRDAASICVYSLALESCQRDIALGVPSQN